MCRARLHIRLHSYLTSLQARTQLATAVATLLCCATAAQSQDVEPRRWAHLPIDTNIVAAAISYTTGDLFFDPVLLIEDADVEIYTAVLSYLRTFDLLGKSARVDLRLPVQSGHWQGLLDGVPTTVTRDGLADPWVRLSVNLYGAPALKGKAFGEFRRSRPTSTVVGAALGVSIPVGEYFEDKLINLGENRVGLRPQIGVVHSRGRWACEATGSAFFYTANNSFWNGNKREQGPFYTMQGHVIYSLKPGMWTSLSTAFGWSGETKINGVTKSDKKGVVLAAASFGFAVAPTSGVKVVYLLRRNYEDVGIDAHNLAFAYTYAF